MRKFLKVAALLSVVAVAACGEKTNEGTEDTTTMAPPAAPMTMDTSTMKTDTTTMMPPAAPDSAH